MDGEMIFDSVAGGLPGYVVKKGGGTREIQISALLGPRLVLLRSGQVELLLSEDGTAYGSITATPNGGGWEIAANPDGLDIPESCISSVDGFIAYSRRLLSGYCS